MGFAAFFKASPKPYNIRKSIQDLQKDVKRGSGKNCLRFWDILGGQVQNDKKTLGKRFWGSRSELFEKMSKTGLEKIVYPSGTFWEVRCRMT